MRELNVKRISMSFTLIELLIVVSIIGILAAIAIPNFMNANIKAKIASTYTRIKTAHTAIASYMLDHQMFPPHGFVGTYDRPVAFSALTTPVNYLGSLDTCEDIFRQYVFLPDDLEERVITKAYFMYDAKSAYDQLRIFTNDSRKDDENKYLLASTGPDGWSPNLYSLPTFHNKLLLSNMNLIYSSTNGLRSKGDIISTNVTTYK